ncbi:uncharacterized protein KY384_003892 [Bacidia gigantensis]|uniref:uncharacterized protein n=1 Tax=Bacidia gigantensis TaxID=2732470 RepID=UPI001D04B16A|nr:uncharacterized protein KY384_003892 [Bacidia gigantensis]KAG8532251.1 hypothetical protein KY384_003892 [Bacidia gigantensis]
MWRTEYPVTLEFGQIAHSWKPDAIVKALETYAADTLEVLDLSSEMCDISKKFIQSSLLNDRERHGSERYCIKTLKGLLGLRMVFLHVTALPAKDKWIKWNESNDACRPVYRRLVDFLPKTVEKIHLCGSLTGKEARQVFHRLIVDDHLSLPNLRHIHTDRPIKINKSLTKRLQRDFGICFKIFRRHSQSDSNQIPFPNHGLLVPEDLFSYPALIGDYDEKSALAVVKAEYGFGRSWMSLVKTRGKIETKYGEKLESEENGRSTKKERPGHFFGRTTCLDLHGGNRDLSSRIEYILIRLFIPEKRPTYHMRCFQMLYAATQCFSLAHLLCLTHDPTCPMNHGKTPVGTIRRGHGSLGGLRYGFEFQQAGIIEE